MPLTANSVIRWSPEYSTVAAHARRTASASATLPADISEYLASRFGADFSNVKLHCDESSAQFTDRLGTAAFACGEHVYFHPAHYHPGSRQTLALLGHELAHTIQQRGGVSRSPSVTLHRLLQLECEANAAGVAVLAGRNIHIEPQPDCPELLPAIPLIVWGLLAAIGAATTTYVVSKNSETVQKDIEADSKLTQSHKHESLLYALIPLAGSIDQVRNGRTAGSRAIGSAFLVMDVFTLGTVKALFVAFKAAGARVVGSGLAKVGGTEAVHATEELVKIGTQFLTKEEATKQLTKVLAGNSTKPVVIASSEGFLNHAVTYIIDPVANKIWKIHGGPFAMFFKKKSGEKALGEMGEGLAKSIVGKSNHLSVFTEGMMKSGGHEAAVNFFTKAIESNAVMNFLKAPGCGGSQILLLSKAGVQVGRGAGSRLLSPAFPLELLRTQGAHMVLNPGMARFGTGVQAGIWGASQSYTRFGNWANTQSIADGVEEQSRLPALGKNGSSGSSKLIQSLEPDPSLILGHRGFGHNLAAYKQDPSNLLNLGDFMQDDDDQPMALAVEELSAEDFLLAMSQGVDSTNIEWTLNGMKTLQLPK